MKHALRLALFTVLTLSGLGLYAQKINYNSVFAKIDSLASNQKAKPALELITNLNARARKEGNTAMIIKSVMYRRLFQEYLEGRDHIRQINLLRQDVAVAKQPEKSILQSLLAETFWYYYSQNSYKISQRSNVEGDIGDDVATWPIPKLLKEISDLYMASLSKVSLLQNTPLAQFDSILIGDKNTRYLRPTLYDLLAHSALPVFRNTRLNILNDTEDSALRFSEQVKMIFNNLLDYHKKHGNRAAYCDVQLVRLKYYKVEEAGINANLPYYTALEELLKESEGTEVYADVLAEMALLHQYEKVKTEVGVNSLSIAVELAKRAIKAYPKSAGASRAQKVLDDLRTLFLYVEAAELFVPGKEIEVSYHYKNTDSLYAGLYRLSLKEFADLKLQTRDSYLSFLKRAKEVKSWVKVLPLLKDYQQHLVKDTLEGLSVGKYLMIVTNRPLLDTISGNSINKYLTFTVGSMAVSKKLMPDNVKNFRVFDAVDGAALEGVKIEEIKRGTKEDLDTKPKVLITDADGFAGTDKFAENANRVLVTKDADSVHVELQQFYGSSSDDDDEEETRIILFTDRPIYRPGQTVFYKGILLKQRQRKEVISVGQKLDVVFKDVNQSEIERAAKISNEYGTFHGSFVIPMGRLNGRMRLVTDFGPVDVNVEEYKRPTFEVRLNTSGQYYNFNDTARVKGTVKTFAGYPVGGATVTYRIVLSSKQVATGQTTSNQNGDFEVSFFAAHDEKEEKEYNRYNLSVDVTDLAGETRSASILVTAGGKGLEFGISNDPREIFLKEPRETSLSIHTQSGRPAKARVQIQWFPLQPLQKLSKQKAFESYTQASDLQNWTVLPLAFEKNIDVENGRIRFAVKEGDLKPGNYRRVVTAISDELDTGVYSSNHRIYGLRPDTILSAQEWVVAENLMIKDGESAVFRVAGFRANSNVFYEISSNGKTSETHWLKVSPLQTIVKVPWKEGYEDQFQIQFLMVQDGIWSKRRHMISRERPSKQLDVKFASFRDKLQPGEKETWKLKITNKAGEKQMAELAATLYDASLDALKTMEWRFYGESFSKRNYLWDIDLVSNRSYRTNSFSFLNTSSRGRVFDRNYEKFNAYSYLYGGLINNSFSNFLRVVESRDQKQRLIKADERLQHLKNSGMLYGLLKDASGYGLTGVKINVNGTVRGVSDGLGIYAIAVKRGDRVSFILPGFTNVMELVAAAKRLDITLNETSDDLDEVVIRGYTARNREQTTGSTMIVSGQEVKDVPVGNVEQLLQGKVAGLSIQNNSLGDGFPNVIDPGKLGSLGNIVPRTNFSESAFFYPQLRTNSKGEIEIEFTIPQSLTRYKMMGFAHTKAFETLYFTRELVTQKQFAITANAPRFFRERDTIILAAKLNNMSDKMLKGKAYLELRDALNGNVIDILAAKTTSIQGFELSDKNNGVLTWSLVIPVGINAITYKVVAESGKYSDGEENTVPVLTNAVLVTETMPLNVRGNTSKTFTMDKLLQSGKSTTMRNQSLTLEFTSNPVWYAIQSLPYLMEYPYECAEQTMSRFYANSFATGILNSSPKIKAVFDAWQKLETSSLSSNLDKNAELKALLIEETPWVRSAGNENEKKKRLAVLFDLNRMSGELKSNFEKLEQLQNASGSFSWFKGMAEDRYITQQIVLNMAQLKYLKMVDERNFPTFNAMLNKALIYLDGKFVADYSGKIAPRDSYAMPLHYLYARSYSKQINEDKLFKEALNRSLEQINAGWLKMNTYEQGLAALVLYRNGRPADALKIVNSLKDRAQQNEETGMYWADNKSGWWWYQRPVETQALMIEVFDEIANDAVAVEEMKIWLLKNKQNNAWITTKATTAACYALIMRGYNLLNESAEPEITIGGKTAAQLGLSDPVKEAGTGYQQINIKGSAVKAEMGTITIKNNNKGIAWGGLYWQYFEQQDKVTSAGTGITIKKELFLQSSTASGPVLTRLTSSNVLKTGDLLKVRIEIRCDRPMEYLHLKDMRSAGFEPVNVISQYKYQDALGYYESTKDASTNFFIGYMPKGVYVFEYPLRVNNAGNFSNGVTTLQSMYAPEFSAHSEGIRVTVK